MFNKAFENEEKEAFFASLDGRIIAKISIDKSLECGSVSIEADSCYAQTFNELSKEIGKIFHMPVSNLNSSEGMIHFVFSDSQSLFSVLDYVLLRMAPCCSTSISRIS